jgi:hypothetical protein
MRLYRISARDGKKRLNVLTLIAFNILAFAGMIGSAEAFWYFLTGGFSPLIGGFAGIAAVLTIIRVVGAALTAPVPFAKTG